MSEPIPEIESAKRELVFASVNIYQADIHCKRKGFAEVIDSINEAIADLESAREKIERHMKEQA